MSELKVHPWFRRMDAREEWLCANINRACSADAVRRFFAGISRAGNGVAWYTLMAALPLAGRSGIVASLHMVAVAVVCLLVYKAVKPRLVRVRPCHRHPQIRLGTAPLDRFSFPSGHTLHAVAFAWTASAHFPELAWVVWPFAGLVAASRVILGLHYPSDVLAGATIGAGIAAGLLAVLPA